MNAKGLEEMYYWYVFRAAYGQKYMHSTSHGGIISIPAIFIN